MSEQKIVYVLHFTAALGRKRKPQRYSHILVGIGEPLPPAETLQAMALTYLAEVKAKPGVPWSVKAREASQFKDADGKLETIFMVPMFDVQGPVVFGTL